MNMSSPLAKRRELDSLLDRVNELKTLFNEERKIIKEEYKDLDRFRQHLKHVQRIKRYEQRQELDEVLERHRKEIEEIEEKQKEEYEKVICIHRKKYVELKNNLDEKSIRIEKPYIQELEKIDKMIYALRNV